MMGRRDTGAAGLAMLLLLALGALCFGQDKVREIKDYPYPAPIAVVGKHLGTRDFDVNGQVVAGRTWVYDVSLDIKNNSGKDIKYFAMEVYTHQHGSLLTGVGFAMDFVARTAKGDENVSTLDDEPKLGPIKPGETVRFRVNLGTAAKLLAATEPDGVDEIDVLHTEIRNIFYVDGSGWSYGHDYPAKPAIRSDHPGGTSGLVFTRRHQDAFLFRVP